ncbi:cysteine synthase family protein [bacterium]|nr:MAG: cysteine synthase family protein [bacterium]QQR61599.1 MAG: cysteine synthase family protein [bacterium]
MLNSLLDAIGNTPLVRLSTENTIDIYAKLEYCNPGGSVKDRSALYMIEYAEKKGLLKPGGTIVDASSGNHGVAVAMIGAIKGYPVIITVSEKISTEKLETIKAYGAKVVVCPATSFIDDPQGYHSVARRIAAETPGSFMPDQYFNIVNAKAHYALLGPELWRQTNGRITHFFAAAGTGGTVSGAGRYLKEQNPAIKVIALDAQTSFYSSKGNPKPYKIEGMGIDFVSPVMDYSIVDEIIPVADEDALVMLKLLPKKYGILAGMSSGAVAYGALHYCQNLPKDSLAVMIFGDSGRAYLSKNLF